MVDIETIRLAFRPNRITTPLVGESAPFNGDFFYYGRTALERVMRSAIEESLGPSCGDFLETFKAYGWYLDDLGLGNSAFGLQRRSTARRECSCRSRRERTFLV